MQALVSIDLFQDWKHLSSFGKINGSYGSNNFDLWSCSWLVEQSLYKVALLLGESEAAPWINYLTSKSRWPSTLLIFSCSKDLNLGRSQYRPIVERESWWRSFNIPISPLCSYFQGRLGGGCTIYQLWVSPELPPQTAGSHFPIRQNFVFHLRTLSHMLHNVGMSCHVLLLSKHFVLLWGRTRTLRNCG